MMSEELVLEIIRTFREMARKRREKAIERGEPIEAIIATMIEVALKSYEEELTIRRKEIG